MPRAAFERRLNLQFCKVKITCRLKGKQSGQLMQRSPKKLGRVFCLAESSPLLTSG
jgi:hypothetical protein